MFPVDNGFPTLRQKYVGNITFDNERMFLRQRWPEDHFLRALFA
jgi:hypothetical protein